MPKVHYRNFVVNMKISRGQLKEEGVPLTKHGMLTPEQCRAARAVLGWSREDLAQKAGVSAGTVVGSSFWVRIRRFLHCANFGRL